MDRARLIDLVGEALDLPADGRAEYLRSRCDDTALLAEGLSLIAAEQTAGGFLDRPTVHGLNTSSAIEGPGSTVGEYRLLELIGEGPAARVYMAEQRGGVPRRVALRLPRSTDGSAEAVTAFESARAALGTHPGIAALLDSGLAESGAAYFVAELIRGRAITDHCDRLELPVRLALFLSLCSVVEHAHSRGVVHLNLNPRNILITDLGGVVKVLDFGLRRSPPGGAGLAAEVRDAALATEYLCPERIENARADVFSLGVLLSRLFPVTPAHVIGHIAANPDPARRFESAGALAEALRRECEPQSAPRKGWLSRMFGH